MSSIEQQTWSKNGSLTSNVKGRQRAVRVSNDKLIQLKARVIDVRENGKLEVLIQTDSTLDMIIGSIWLPLKIDVHTFITNYGDLASFKEQMNDIKFVLNYYFPNYKQGYITVKEQLSTIENKNQSEIYSLNTIINGLSIKDNQIKRIMKSDFNSEASVKLENKSVFISASKTNFMEVSESGINLGGNTNIQGSPNKFKFGGFVSMQNFFLGLIPSTYTSPISSFKLSLPTEQLSSLKDIAGILSGAIL